MGDPEDLQKRLSSVGLTIACYWVFQILKVPQSGVAEDRIRERRVSFHTARTVQCVVLSF